MIYILSDEFDISTQNIASWLDFYNKSYIILNTHTRINKIKVTISYGNFKLKLSTKTDIFEIDPEKDRFFYRRGFLQFPSHKPTSSLYFDNFLKNEQRTLREFLENFMFHSSSNIKSKKELNKLEVLIKAAKLNIRIPKTMITSCKSDVIKFSRSIQNEEIITKPIYEAINLQLENGFLKTYTSLLKKEDIQNLDDEFAPTLFQEKINKWIDVRSFYLKGKFYSMAIFSQDNNQTSIDFRDYDYVNPNKVTPFLLPSQVNIKLKSLFKELYLESGSVDLCVDGKNQFTFFEINPVGQYDMVSEPCNYHLNREIAKII
jgi:ATP-GRASP peptide maturase of grasp-with-spasm system